MNNIIDYIKWRGDLTIFDRKFNKIDYLILSELAYINLDYLSINNPISLYEAYKTYLEYPHKTDECHFLFSMCANSIRYSNIKIVKYINEVDKDLIKQFSAITFMLEDYNIVVSYRGTDDSLIGWHEDFLMLYEDIVPSQDSALNYLNNTNFSYPKGFFDTLKDKSLGNIIKRFKAYLSFKKGLPITVVGHSKGGNLALYASCFSNENIKNRIVKVYNFDGPGFQQEIIDSDNYQGMLDRIVSYIPEYSFFGIVLGHEENYYVVTSQYKGMYQHNPFSWSIERNDFVYGELSEDSVNFAIKVILFLEKLEYHQKKEFIDALFNLFDSLGLYHFSELGHISIKTFLDGIKEIHMLDNEVKKTLIEAISIMWSESLKAKKE